MLTREHAIADVNFRSRQIVPDRLLAQTHGHYIAYAEAMLSVYREASGRRRRDIHRDIETIFAADKFYHPRRVAAFCKLLDDKSSYARDSNRDCAKLRAEVFLAAGRHHPLVSQAEGLFDQAEPLVKANIAMAYQQSWPQIEDQLFNDVLGFNQLTSFDASAYPDARALLARYNVAQFQAALFDAVQMRIHATTHLKSIMRFAKLADLMHTILRNEDGSYLIKLDGPASVLNPTRRYGTSMAKFLPGLLSCAGWRLDADLQRGRLGLFHLALSPTDGLRSPVLAPDEFDSNVERDFAEKWGPEPRAGWKLERENEPLVVGQHVYFPDFQFRHESGETVLAEIIGYWRPDYLTEKRETLQRFAGKRLMLILRESAAAQFADLGFSMVTYKTAIKLDTVLQTLGMTLPWHVRQ